MQPFQPGVPAGRILLEGTCRRLRSGSRRLLLAASGLLFLLLAQGAWAQTAALTATVSGPPVGVGGGAYSYSIILTNIGPNGANGAAFANTVPTGSTAVAATCQGASGGAACPASFTVSGTQVTATVPTLPIGGSLTIVVTGNFPFITVNTTLTDSATITPPPGTTNPNPAAATTAVSTAVSTTSVTDLTVTKSANTAAYSTADGTGSITYTVNYFNNGPAAADGATVSDYFNIISDITTGSNVYSAAWNNATCTAAGGAVCPAVDTINGSTASADDRAPHYPWNSLVIPTFPAGARITITYTVTFSLNAGACSSAQIYLPVNYATIAVPNGLTESNTANNTVNLTNTQSANNPQRCANVVSVSKTADTATFPGLGVPITYTVTYTNNSPNSADGALIVDNAYLNTTTSPSNLFNAAWNILSCTPNGGAACPAALTPPKNGSATPFNITPGVTPWGAFSGSGAVSIPTFPVGSSITIVYTLTLTQNPAAPCSTTPANYTLYNAALITDPNTGVQNNALNILSVVPGGTACPTAQLAVTKTASQTTFPGLNNPVSYTVTYTNNGSTDASGAYIADQVYVPTRVGDVLGSLAWSSPVCTASGGAACPAETISSGSLGAGSGYFYLWGDVTNTSTTIPAFPAGSSVTFTYTVAVTSNPNSTTCGGASSLQSVANTASVNAPTNMIGSATVIRSVSLAVTCADISVNTQVSAVEVQPSAPVSYAITLTNGGPSAATNVNFSDPLPAGFVYASASCSSAGGGTCGALTYDPVTGTLSGVMPSIPNGQSVTITINGTSTATTGTVANQACATLPAGGALIDPNATSNCSAVSFRVLTQSPITVIKTVAGGPAGGLPQALTFTGTVACGAQTVQNWSATIPAGGSSASASPLSFFDGDSCAVTEDAPPAAPAGYAWGAPAFAPAAIATLGPSTPVTVTVTNTLSARPVVDITKTSSLATALPPGGTVVYTVTAKNTSSATASNVSVTDTLPAAGIASATWTCAGSGAACPSDKGDGAVNQVIATLPAGASVTYTITATATSSVPATVVNTATLTGPDLLCASGAPLPCPATATIPAMPVIAISKTASTTAALTPGGQVTYTVKVTNAGTVDASAVTVADPLPAGVASATWSCTGAGATCPLGNGSGAVNQLVSLPAGASVTYSILATAVTDPASLPAQVVNTASASGAGFICATGAAPPCEATVTNPTPDLRKPPLEVKSVSAVDARTLRWTITLDNNANAAAQSVELRDPLPAAMSVAAGSVSCQAFGGTTQSHCDFDAVNNRIVVDAALAPDTGVTNAAAGPNRLVVSFNATFAGAAAAVTNQAQACWAVDNDTGSIAACALSVTAQASYDPNSGRNGDPAGTTPVPLSRNVIWILLMLLCATAVYVLPIRQGRK